MTNHAEYANLILETLRTPSSKVPLIENEESRKNNAARCMVALFCNRMSTLGEPPKRVRHTTFQWGGGLFALRNSRIIDHHWSTLQLAVAEDLHNEAVTKPIAFVLTYWAVEENKLHVWAIPEDIAHIAFAEIPENKGGSNKTVELFVDSHDLKRAPNAPDLSQFYIELALTDEESAKLVESIKLDHSAKRAAQNDGDSNASDDDDNLGDGTSPFFTSATTDFINELLEHQKDSDWHNNQKLRYQRVLRDPVRKFVDELREKYIARLSPEVAGSKRNLSILRKNDYGRGRYHDHYWFAFYDPNSGSKTRSVQLFFRMIASEGVWRYGLAMGNYCDGYVENLHSTILSNPTAISEYLRQSPPATNVAITFEKEESELSPAEFADLIISGEFESHNGSRQFADIRIVREFPLDSLPDHDDGIVEEVGKYFVWLWPFFSASVTGTWIGEVSPSDDASDSESESVGDVDENAPSTIAELAEFTSLSEKLLEELEQALLAKQQAILVGPPGTSKTYIARQFARYFVRQRSGRPQGSHHVLYMHSNWTYEDFFEGIKPSTGKNGILTFESRKGFFLEWVEQLKEYDSSARHVLVLDEINRCDTAAVLGELLQLLEYRGTTVRLLSGRKFVFPRNLYIIGTMNSADRSIGRMDLALRRRFLWLNLYAQPDALQRWLSRTGNNPVGLNATALTRCNDLLLRRGISPEQHIGHALFMVQEADVDDEETPAEDIPLTEKHLRRTVQFSVLPYVRELFTTQFGKCDESIIDQIRTTILSCLNEDDDYQEADLED